MSRPVTTIDADGQFIEPECAAEPEMWFATDGSSDTDIALTICGRCPFVERCRTECETFERGLTYGIYGVWGGETVEMRSTRRRKERREQGVPAGTLSGIEVATGWPEAGGYALDRETVELGLEYPATPVREPTEPGGEG